MCLYPRLVPNPRYKANKKNGGNVPIMKDKRVGVVPIGCGNCIECRKQRRMEWVSRLQFEFRNSDRRGYFVTFTFNNGALVKLKQKVYERNGGEEVPYYELVNLQSQIAIEFWRENVRKWMKYHKINDKHPKFWFTTELGGENGRIHLHGFVWTNTPEVFDKWKFGFKKVDPISEGRINYATKYVVKTDPKNKGYKPKLFVSNGLGEGYTKTFNATNHVFRGKDTIETYRQPNGLKVALPKYYRNKLWTDEEREALWICKLDKQERWVLGQRIDISKGMDEYYSALINARKVSKMLGYDVAASWEMDFYKRQVKMLAT